MRRYSTALLVSLFVLTFASLPMLGGEQAAPSCTKAEKACSKEKAECCKAADAKCCESGSDKECCKKASCDKKKS